MTEINLIKDLVELAGKQGDRISELVGICEELSKRVISLEARNEQSTTHI